MAKKKTVKRTTRKKRTSSRKKNNLISTLFYLCRQIGKWGVILFVCLIVTLFAVDYWQRKHDVDVVKEETVKIPPGIDMPEPQTGTKPKPQPANPSAQTKKEGVFTMPEGAEIPRLMEIRSEQVIEHEGYVVSYNSDYKIANWVAYELTDEEVKNKNVERSNKFVPDPMVKGATALNEDYVRTGFDRGHLAPAGDMRWSAKAMRESFYYSNICPQHPKLNRGIWKTLEEQIRVWALDYEAVYIATGPVIEEEMRVMGKNRVGVPESFYKVICVVTDNRPIGIGFLFENRDYKKTTLRSMVIPIDSVEKVTGIDFFYRLPLDIQKQMESKVEWEYWKF